MKNEKHDFGILIAGDMVAPCVGCKEECNPAICTSLGKWIERLAEEE
jgi:hypothetical protein